MKYKVTVEPVKDQSFEYGYKICNSEEVDLPVELREPVRKVALLAAKHAGVRSIKNIEIKVGVGGA